MPRVEKTDRKSSRLEEHAGVTKHSKSTRPHKNNTFHKIERIARSARSIDECADMLDEFDDTDF